MPEQQTLDDRFAKFAGDDQSDQSLDQRFAKFATASVADRHNNPLNIKVGPLTQRYLDEGSAEVGENATDGGQFLRFQSADDGYAAAHNLLLSPAYKDLPIDAALKKWSHGGYGALPGFEPSTKISALSLDDRQKLIEAMAKREGFSGAAGSEGSDANDSLTAEDHATLQATPPARLIDLPHAEQIGRNNAFVRSIQPSTSQPPSFAETAAKLQEPISKRILGFSLSDVANKYLPEPAKPTLAGEAGRRSAKTVAGFLDFMQSPEALAAALAEAVTAGGATPVVASLMGAQFATQGGKQAATALDDMRTKGLTPENTEQFFGGLAVGVGGLIGPAAANAHIKAKEAALKVLTAKEQIHDTVASTLQDHLTNAAKPAEVPAAFSEPTDNQPALALSPEEAAPKPEQQAVAAPAAPESLPLEQRFADQAPLEERFTDSTPPLSDDDYLEMADKAAESGERPPEVPKPAEQGETTPAAPPVTETARPETRLQDAAEQLKNAPIREKAPEVVRDPEFAAYAQSVRSLAQRNLPDLVPDIDAAIDLYDAGKPGKAMTKLEIARQELHGEGKRLAEAAAAKVGMSSEDLASESAQLPPAAGENVPRGTPEPELKPGNNPVKNPDENLDTSASEPPLTREQIIRDGAATEMHAWAQSVRDAQDQLKRGESAQTTESNAAGKEIEEQVGAHANAIRSLGVKEGSPVDGLTASPDEMAKLIEDARDGVRPRAGTKRAELLDRIEKAFHDSYTEAHGDAIDEHLSSLNEAREPENDADISFGFGSEAGRAPVLDYAVRKLSDAYDALKEYVTIDVIPRLTKAGVQKEGVAHAVSRVAVPQMISDMLAKVFPEDYKNPAKMQKVMRVMVLDNILGAYDQLKTSAAFAWQRGDETAMERFLKLADNVEQKHDLKAYAQEVQQALLDADARKAIDRWKQTVNPTMDELYNEAKGMDPAYPRDSRGRYFGARVNLLAKEHVPDWLAATVNDDKPMPEPAAASYRNPNVRRDRFDRLTKLTADEYSDDPVAVLASALFPRYNEVTKLRFYKSLIDTNSAAWDKPTAGTIGGEEVRGMPVQVPETKAGETRQVTKVMWVPKSLVEEIRGVLGTDVPLKQNPVAAVLTKLQLAQFADATAHLKNIHSVIANAQGLKSFLADIGRKFPGISSADTFTRVGKVMYDIYQDKPAIRSELADMAKQGMIRQHYPATGIQKLTKMADLIHSVDTASRVTMNRFYSNLVDRGLAVDTANSRRAFVQQIGEYNRRLMGPLQRAAAQSGLSPFIVAGRTFNRFSRRLLTGNPGFEATSTAAAVKARMVNLVTLGSLATIPAMWNVMRTGSFTGRAGTPVGAIDLGMPADQRGNHKVLDLMQLYGIRRGLRSIGADALLNGMVNHERANDIAGKAISDSTSGAMHPWLGPAAGFAFSALTGQKLDLRGGPIPEEAARMEGKGSQYAENLRVAAKNSNLLLYSPLRKAFGDVEKTPLKDFASDFLKSPASAIGLSDRPTPAIQAAHELSIRVPTTPAQRERQQIRRQILNAPTDDAANALITQNRAKLKQDEITEVRKERRMNAIARAANRESVENIVHIWQLATPEEQETLHPILSKKIMNSDPKTAGRAEAIKIRDAYNAAHPDR